MVARMGGKIEGGGGRKRGVRTTPFLSTILKALAVGEKLRSMFPRGDDT